MSIFLCSAMTRQEAEVAYESYLQSYFANGMALAPSPEAREQLILNFMNTGRMAPTPPQAPKDYEKKIAINSTHDLIMFFKGGKNLYNITRMNAPPEPPPAPPVMLSNCTWGMEYALRLFNAEIKLMHLCEKGIKEAC